MRPTEIRILYIGRQPQGVRQLTDLLREAGYQFEIGPANRPVQTRGKAKQLEMVVRGKRKSGDTAVPLTLRLLREKTGKTQAAVARGIAMSQPQLSRVEARRDHLISTLRKYIGALGGDIEVIAIVDGRRFALRDV